MLCAETIQRTGAVCLNNHRLMIHPQALLLAVVLPQHVAVQTRFAKRLRRYQELTMHVQGKLQIQSSSSQQQQTCCRSSFEVYTGPPTAYYESR
jgi:hypothetical protein